MKEKFQSAEEMKAFASTFAQHFGGVSTSATLVALQGELGAGKTAFTQFVAKELGVKEQITSPTYVIQKSYELPSESPFDTLVHIDAYRLESAKELEVLGFHGLLSEPSNIIFLEWPERVESILPRRRVEVNLSHCGEECREIEVVFP